MANSSEKSSIGMPQLDFSNFDNQTFWLIFVSYSSIFSNKTSCNATNGRDFNES